MTFVPKDWRNATTYAGGGDTSTPVTAESLEDLETRVTDYADLRVGRLVFDVKEYGALGDGSTDDTAAIQDAIDAAEAAEGGIVWFPPTGNSYYKITSALSIAGPRMTLRGAGLLATRIHLASATATAIAANASQSGLAIEDLMVTSWSSSDTRTAGASISVQNYGDVRIKNCWLRCGWVGISLVSAYTIKVENVVIDDLSGVTGGGISQGIVADGGCISIRLEDIYIGAQNSPSAVSGLQIESGMDTFVGRGLEIIGTWDYGIRIRNVGASFDPRWIRLTDCVVEPDNTAGIAVELGGCEDVEFKGLYTAWGLYGVHVGAATKQMRIIGGIVQLAYQYGILIEGGKDISVNGTLVSDCSQASSAGYSGIVVAPAASEFHLSNVRSGNVVWHGTGGYGANQKYGIEILAGASNYYFVVNCDLRTNLTGGLADGGSGVNKVVTGNLP